MFVVLFWIGFGALVGLIVGILQGKADTKGSLVNILVGVLGGLLGGYVSLRLTTQAASYDSRGTSMMFAVFVALLFATLVGKVVDGPPDVKR